MKKVASEKHGTQLQEAGVSLTGPTICAPHICIVAVDIWPILVDDRRFPIVGGLQVQLSILARAFVRAGFRVSVVTMDFGQPDGVIVDGITVYRAHRPDDGLPVLRFFHPRISSWWAAMRRANADVYIQRSAAYLTAIVGLYARWHGKRFIYSGAHDLDFKRDQTWQLFRQRTGWRDRKMFEWGLRLAHGVVAQHNGQADDCRRWYRREATVIPNCYSFSPSPKEKAAEVILWTARIESWKRPELFLELARSLPHLRFRMVGGPAKGMGVDLFERIRNDATALPNVEFVGFVPYAEVGAHFDEAKMFVNTSTYEGFPNTFLQAWARGVPTLSFVDCGAREGGRPVGFVCRDLAEMRRVILRLSEVANVCQEEGLRARCYFEFHHSVDVAVTRYSRLIEKVLALAGRA